MGSLISKQLNQLFANYSQVLIRYFDALGDASKLFKNHGEVKTQIFDKEFEESIQQFVSVNKKLQAIAARSDSSQKKSKKKGKQSGGQARLNP